MKKLILYIFCLLLILNFNACTSKTEQTITDTKENDIEKLLQIIIEKEKEINELNKQIETCKSSKH